MHWCHEHTLQHIDDVHWAAILWQLLMEETPALNVLLVMTAPIH